METDECFDDALFERLVGEFEAFPISLNWHEPSRMYSLAEVRELCRRYCKACDKQDFEGTRGDVPAGTESEAG
jgi:hypothetical protein